MDSEKISFITFGFITLTNTLSAEKRGKWGKMNAQQMTEHLSDFFKVSSEKLIIPLVSSPEHLVKLKAFLLSDKQFRENTKAPGNVLPDEPFSIRNPSFEDAINELQQEINDFVTFFKNKPERKTTHPVFGELNFEEWVLLHYKHLSHHARQFELID